MCVLRLRFKRNHHLIDPLTQAHPVQLLSYLKVGAEALVLESESNHPRRACLLCFETTDSQVSVSKLSLLRRAQRQLVLPIYFLSRA
jgi:hypothetical protein